MPNPRAKPLVFRDYPAGQTIFKENDPGETMFIVRSGRVRLTLSKMDVEIVEPGGFLGEMVLLHNAPRTTTAVAETDCSLQELDSHAFIDQVRATPFFAVNVLRTMARRIRKMDAHVSRTTRFSRVIHTEDISPEMLKAAKSITTVSKGAFILRQNEEGELMYCLRRGKAELKVNSILVETIGVGGIVGELALLDPQPRSATCIAVEECDLLSFDEERFEYLLAMTPDFTFRMMHLLAKRLRAIDRAVSL
jgi:CRP/FNR family transcriptional regulator, cyclic AMP receptor protein